MHRMQNVAALSAALMLAGCGQPNNPPANTATQQPSNAALPEYTPPVQPAANETVSPEMEVETTSQESSLTSGKSRDDLAGEIKESTQADQETVTRTEEPAGADRTAIDEEAHTAKPRSNRPARRLLRGLGSSLTRALSKAANASGQGADTKESDSGGKPPQAPKLEDDPFPNGEPADGKPVDNNRGDARPNE